MQDDAFDTGTEIDRLVYREVELACFQILDIEEVPEPRTVFVVGPKPVCWY